MQKAGYKTVSEVYHKVDRISKMLLKSAGSFKPNSSNA